MRRVIQKFNKNSCFHTQKGLSFGGRPPTGALPLDSRPSYFMPRPLSWNPEYASEDQGVRASEVSLLQKVLLRLGHYSICWARLF